MKAKKLLALTLALAALLVQLPTAALGADSDFIIDANGVLTKYDGSGGDVAIPESVTGIGNYAFSECTSLISVTIPDSVTSIGNFAFFRCGSLTSVTIPGSVTSIGGSAFSDCASLTSMAIPDSVTNIGTWVFYGCTGLAAIQADPGNKSYNSADGVLFNKSQSALVAYPGGRQGAYTIPNSVTYIREGAFSGCTGLTSVTIPDSVTGIESTALFGCTGLTAIQVGPGNESYSSAEGVLFNKSQSTLVAYPGGRQGAYTIPNSVTYIGDWAFSGCTGPTSVTILDSVAAISGLAFENCASLTIYGKADSKVETYCKANGIPFDLLENAPTDPTPSPSTQPSTTPSAQPSTTPSIEPTESANPSAKPSAAPTPSPKPVAVTGVSVAKTASVQVDRTKTLTATVKPSNATNKGVYWTSDDTYVVSVDTNGKLTGVKEGTATVIATTVDGGFTAKCEVTVTKATSSGGGGGTSGGGSGAAGGGGGGGAAKPSATPSAKPIDTSKPASENFNDVVKDSWYEAGVTYVVKKGLFNGVADRTFAPQQNMTRAMLVTVLARLDGQSTEGGSTWYAKATDWAKAQGVSDGTMLDQSVTREQMVTMLYRYAKAAAGTADLSAFADGATVSDWAKDAMAWAVEQGILTGKDGALLDPQGTATRAEVATILQRFVEKK